MKEKRQGRGGIIKHYLKIQWKKSIIVFVVVVFICSFMDMFLPQGIQAADKRNVKVAFFPMDGYHIKENGGNYDGMDVQYLDVLCEYADWRVEYVECESWDEALKLLADQNVDLVGSAQFSEERAKIYQYASLPSGYTFGAIAAKGDSLLAYEDFEAMQKITFGMVKTYVRKNEFLQYMKDHGIVNPKLKMYDSTADLLQALEEGQIDAYIHTFTEVRQGHRLLGRFAPMPFYYRL